MELSTGPPADKAVRLSLHGKEECGQWMTFGKRCRAPTTSRSSSSFVDRRDDGIVEPIKRYQNPSGARPFGLKYQGQATTVPGRTPTRNVRTVQNVHRHSNTRIVTTDTLGYLALGAQTAHE